MRERVGEKRRVIKHQFKEAREVNSNKGGAEGRDEERGGGIQQTTEPKKK